MLITRETYAPFILRRRAKALSRMTGSVYVSWLDAGKPPKKLSQELSVSFTRPWVLLFRESIVLLTSLYISIVYGTLYMFLAGFPIVFQGARGWNQGVAGPPFISVAVGVCLVTLAAGVDNKRYVRLCAAAEKAGRPLEPEARLRTAMVGSIVLPIGLFLFVWTTYPFTHWIAPVIGATMFSCGLVMVFISVMSYMIDSCKFSKIHSSCSWTCKCSPMVRILSTQLPSWPRTRCSDLYSAPLSRFSRPACTRTLEINGRVPSLRSWCSGVCPFHFCSIGTDCSSVLGAIMLLRSRRCWS